VQGTGLLTFDGVLEAKAAVWDSRGAQDLMQAKAHGVWGHVPNCAGSRSRATVQPGGQELVGPGVACQHIKVACTCSTPLPTGQPGHSGALLADTTGADLATEQLPPMMLPGN
jgi:hypothetical protein